ncbi:hypothetical protein B6I21_08185 [candidate division KSB1 bacterium 4572_119]|nr:MAG: hypothetical protein B6I21_08185 [candidate division KSB1 bacterium 4572_119]
MKRKLLKYKGFLVYKNLGGLVMNRIMHFNLCIACFIFYMKIKSVVNEISLLNQYSFGIGYQLIKKQMACA